MTATSRHPRPVRAVVCDIDHTLTTQGSAGAMARALGVPAAAHSAIYRDHQAGQLDHARTRAQLLTLWRNTGRATRQTFTTAFETVPLREGATRLAAHLHDPGILLCLITSSAQLYADITAARLGAVAAYGNGTLIFDAAGHLTDLDFSLDTGPLKARHLARFCAEHHISPDEIIAVGNGPDDRSLFEVTGRGILLTRSTTSPQAAAWRTATTLEAVTAVIDEAGH
ncbi:HAD family hydrolase [Streptomyces sp. NPDC101227]|uniref:HAD family hydrolase n=1 Tax=Streptomyces sp. NPDC101227 TaxID=3366136 RepID=UPI0037F42587